VLAEGTPEHVTRDPEVIETYLGDADLLAAGDSRS
jgi:ABC-type uncharacterized transport system ATPase subunit